MTAAMPKREAAIAPTRSSGWQDLGDEELISAYQDGRGPTRDEAVEELFQRHQSRIERWCYRFTRDRDSAMDLSQEVFLRVFRNLDNYRGECRFSTWLYVIARNYCMTAMQRRSVEPVWAAKAITTDVPDTLSASADFHMRLEKDQIRRQSWRMILETLDQTEAKVMLLHYGQELSLAAVGQMLGLTNKSGAKAYIVSAKRKLSAALGSAHRIAA